MGYNFYSKFRFRLRLFNKLRFRFRLSKSYGSYGGSGSGSTTSVLFALVAGVLAGGVWVAAGPVGAGRLGLTLPALRFEPQHCRLARHVLQIDLLISQNLIDRLTIAF
jgi:hypothetical protein